MSTNCTPPQPPPMHHGDDVNGIIHPDGHHLAFVHCAGTAPAVFFCGGFHSSMEGTKARYLQQICQEHGWAYTRFDYRGHGCSGAMPGVGTISQWLDDARRVFLHTVSTPAILVGSSMGVWIAVRLALQFPEQILALLGVAAAPDFTEQLIRPALNEAQRQRLDRGHIIHWPNGYDQAAPYPISAVLLEDGRNNLILTRSLVLPFPVHLLHGTDDTDVPWSLSEQLLQRIDCPIGRLTLVKYADHRFSNPECLALLRQTLADLRASISG